jgi:AraC-like DNA-binding protein
MPEPTVSAGFARGLIEFAAGRGCDRTRLMSIAGLRPDDLADQDNRVPFARYIALMRTAKALSGDPALALEYGAATDYREFSVIGLIAHAAATMGEAFAQLNRYAGLAVEVEGLADGPRFEVVEEGGQSWMVDRRANPNDFPELTETAWGRFIVGTRRAFPHVTYAAAAQVSHPAPAYRDAYERLWQVPVTFSAGRNAILSHPDFSQDIPIQPQGRPETRYVFGVLTERAEALLEGLKGASTMRGRVEGLLMPLLHTGDVGINVIAGKLQTSRQTLYRSLKAEGVTFEQVLDGLRHRMALHYLAGRHVSVNETAYLVGFSDPAAFSRAFKRWTGRSPREARAR